MPKNPDLMSDAYRTVEIHFSTNFGRKKLDFQFLTLCLTPGGILVLSSIQS